MESISQGNFTYEHFPVVCPTCQGKGELEEEKTSGMVTFVPVKDERLRPAWTKLKIGILLFVIICISGATAYFLYPRGVHINITAQEVDKFNFNVKYPWILYKFTMTATNSNFFPVKLNDLFLRLSYLQVIVANVTSPEIITIGIKSQKKVKVLMNVSYTETAKYIRQQCYFDQYYVPQLMVSSAELSYWMHSEHINSEDEYFFTDCGKFIFPYPTQAKT